MTISPKPIALIILDGWGLSDKIEHNPIRHSATPTFDRLFSEYPNITLEASGEAVGLPDGQMGNSEVGHLHIGAGRKILQDLTQIHKAIVTGTFQQNVTLLKAINSAKKNNGAIHILGLLSPGGVHSHEEHIMAMIQMVANHGITKNYCHAILDGRDTPPQSANASLQKVSDLYKNLPGGRIANIIGRYYAMDRDNRWERTQIAYDFLTQGHCKFAANNPIEALEQAYARGETDEFVKPTAIYNSNAPQVLIQDNDVVIFMNFRADRARQLTRAFIQNPFTEFNREVQPTLADYVTLTCYDATFNIDIAFPPPDLNNTLGEYLAKQGKRQLRIAETEKYAHVTYFINGGCETQYPNEERILIPSPKIATYDLKPEMSAIEVTDKLIDAIEHGDFDAIICNYANPDMIGHTGKNDAACKTIVTIDHCLERILEALTKVGGEALITSDHGNIEIIYDETTKQPHTAHTTNPVPLIYYGRRAHFIYYHGALDDIAPTMLYLLGLTPPPEMTGRCLLKNFLFFTLKRLYLALTLVLFCVVVHADDTPQKTLSQINNRIANIKQDLNVEQSQRNQLQQDLKTLELNAAKLQLKVQKNQQTLKEQQKFLQQVQLNVQTERQELAQQQALLTKQIRTAYMLKRQPYLKLILNQQNTNEIQRVLNYYRYISHDSAAIINHLQNTLGQLQTNQQLRQTQLVKLKILQSQHVKEQQKLSQVKNDRLHLIKTINRTINNKNLHLSQLVSNKRQLETTIEYLNRNAPLDDTSQSNFPTLQGKLNWPVEGRLIPYFGTKIHESELRWGGDLISAHEGQSVRAVAAGKVIYANWLPGYGLLMIISHGHGYMTLYGRNHTLYKSVGDTVQADEMIATVGQSGGYEKPALYFAIRLNAKPLSPSLWCKNNTWTRRYS